MNKPREQGRAASPPYSSQVREERGLPNQEDAPWLKAQLHHDDRFLRMSVQIQNWQRIAAMAWFAVLGMGGGLVYMAAQSRVEPVFVQVDKLGRTHVVATGPRDGEVNVGDLINREMRDFIENVRSVTSDYSQNNKAVTAAFSRLTGAAHGYVKDDLLAKKPNDVAQTKTVVVDITLAFPITDGGQRNSWQIEWSETSYNLKGEQMGAPELWKANIQYELHPGGRSVESVTMNPVGFYIPSLSWAKVK